VSTARSRRARRTACELAVNTHSDIKANSHRHARHDTDGTVSSCLVGRCELGINGLLTAHELKVATKTKARPGVGRLTYRERETQNVIPRNARVVLELG